MECLEIKKHLSEYIDHELDAEKMAQIENHLKSCADCGAELKAMETIIQTLGSIDVMKAPDGFMEEVRHRIEHRSRLSGVFRSMFIPFRVKIPIQAASLVTASLLVFLIFHHMRTAEEVATLVQKPAMQATAEKAMPAAPEPAKAKKISTPKSRLLKAESVQLILLVSRGGRSAPFSQEKPIPLEENRLAQVAGKRKESPLDGASGAKAREEAMADKAYSNKANPVEKLMNRWTRETNGRILYTRNDEVTGRPIQFSVEIPAGQLAAFLKKLSEIGSLENRAPAAPRAAKEMVSLNIRLVYDR